MKTSPGLCLSAIMLAIFVTVSQAFALESTHIITIALRATAENLPVTRGDVITTTTTSSRISTADVIDAIGDAKGIVFNNRARLLLVRHNVGEQSESAEVLVRQPDLADCNADDMIIFSSASSFVSSGTFNTATGRDRTTLLYIGNLQLDIPGTANLLTSGPTTEKSSSVRLDGQEVNVGLTSLSLKLAGDGLILDDGEIFVVVDGTMSVGVGKITNP